MKHFQSNYFKASIFKPLYILPITFFETASGLIIDNVLSIF